MPKCQKIRCEIYNTTSSKRKVIQNTFKNVASLLKQFILMKRKETQEMTFSS